MGSPVVWTGTLALTALRDTIGDPEGSANPRWSNETLVNYLNRGGQQVVLNTEDMSTLETMWDTTLVASQREYKMPDNFIRDRKVEWHVGGSVPEDDVRKLHNLSQADYEEWFSRDQTVEGEPTHYFFWRRLGADLTSVQPTSIFLHPIPSTSQAGDTLRVLGWKVPDAIDTDTLTKTLEFEGPLCEAVIIWAAHLVKLDDDDGQMADRLEARFERQILKILDYNSRKTRSRRPRVKVRNSTLAASADNVVLPWERGY